MPQPIQVRMAAATWFAAWEAVVPYTDNSVGIFLGGQLRRPAVVGPALSLTGFSRLRPNSLLSNCGARQAADGLALAGAQRSVTGNCGCICTLQIRQLHSASA